MKRPYGQVVGTAIVDGKLLCEIVQRIEGMAGIEAFRSSRWLRSTLPSWRGVYGRQTMPEFNHAQGWISAAHIPDELPFCFRMLVWMAVRPSGLADQGCRTSIPALLPEVDVRPALVVFPTGAADAVFFCILHERLPVCHVLCYTLVHERYGLLSSSCCVVTQL